jgi:hypothetical protein
VGYFAKPSFSWDMEAQGIYIYENIGIGHDGCSLLMICNNDH